MVLNIKFHICDEHFKLNSDFYIFLLNDHNNNM